MVIVSDTHKSIENGFNAVYEIAEHGLCAFHLLKNLKKNHKSLPMEDSFNKCARAYTPLEFEYYMRQLEQLSPSMGISWKQWEDISGSGHFLGEKDTRLLQPTSLKV